MADVTYRGNLKAASFPFLSELFGRSVIVKGQDQNYTNVLAAKESAESSLGVPQIYYAHNVIPTDSGYKSISYDQFTEQAYPSTAGFSDAHVLRDSTGATALFSVDAVGNCYIMEVGSSVWSTPATPPAAGTIAGKRVTTAFISGVSYVFFSGVGCYTYDFVTNAMTAVTLTGLIEASILGIVANKGYMIAYSADSFAWSSVTDPTNFTPSLETGAGGGQLEGIRGVIRNVVEVYGGLVVFAADNCIAVTYSGNPRYPYDFSAIPGAGGLADPSHVTSDVGSGTVYAYTESGVQAVTLRNATTVFPEVTDFISGALFEDYNEFTDELEMTDASGSTVRKKIVLVADRYVIVSYGVEKLTHALYFDISHKQWGRLKLDHVACFEFLEYPSATVELPKKSIAFLNSGGGISILNPDIINPDANGVMLLGKFQYVRSRLLQLQAVEMENVNQGDTFNCLLFPSMDGKNLLAPIQGYLALSRGKFRKYSFHTNALNHTICFKGAFNAVSFLLTFSAGGGR